MNKEYFFYSTITDEKITGIKDGTSQIVFSEKLSKNYLWLDQFMWLKPGEKWMNINELNINDFDGELAFQLKKTAKLTDLLSFGPFIYGCTLISNKLKEIVEKYSLENYIFKKVDIYNNKGVKLEDIYFLMQIPILSVEDVNFKQTFFYRLFQQGAVEFQDFDMFYSNDFNEYVKNQIGFTCGNVSFINKPKVDIISLPFADLISSELKDEIEKNNISNIKFTSFNKENKRIHHISQKDKVFENIRFN